MKICCLILLLIAPLVVHGQGRTATSGATELSGCSQESFETAEAAFRLRRGSSALLITERKLKEALHNCWDSPSSAWLQDHLRVVQEEIADSYLAISRFYLSHRFYRGKGGPAGAFSRLNAILERFPHYSKIDRVLSPLGKINIVTGKPDQAAECYQRMVRDFPTSQLAAEASFQLNAIDVMKIMSPQVSLNPVHRNNLLS